MKTIIYKSYIGREDKSLWPVEGGRGYPGRDHSHQHRNASSSLVFFDSYSVHVYIDKISH